MSRVAGGMYTPQHTKFLKDIEAHLSGFLEEGGRLEEVERILEHHAEGDQCHTDEDFMTQFEGRRIIRNPPVPVMYEHALKHERGSNILRGGALAALSGSKTGRSPKDKRVVDEPSTSEDVWWGPVNIKMSERSFLINRSRALDYLNTRDALFVIDAYAAWDENYRLKIRIVCERAYHALFMTNMLIRPTPEELKNFGKPDFVIYNAGAFPCNRLTEGVTSSTSVAINFARKEMVILGTEYAGEMKKGVLTLMMYYMMKKGALPLHSSCNEGKDGRTTLFFGLSGTGKTTLSADPERLLIGDDEHVWTDDGVFNIEGGCYAKCINLSRDNEPEIYDAIKFGALVENVVYDVTRKVDWNDSSITENTRCSYPLEFIPNAKIPAIGNHPSNCILLTCDAFGVLPPVSKLTSQQVMYHFTAGYTAKVAGTEMGITEPTVAFSACYGSPFLVMHPVRYSKKLAEQLEKHNAPAWLLNTGWTGGGYGVGSRMKLKYTRAMIDAIHDGSLADEEYETMPVFGLQIPKKCNNVPTELLNPRNNWADKEKYDEELKKLATKFIQNFHQYEGEIPADVVEGGPKL